MPASCNPCISVSPVFSPSVLSDGSVIPVSDTRGQHSRTLTTLQNMEMTCDLVSRYLEKLSPREEANLEKAIMDAISHVENGVKDPVIGRNIRTLGWVQSLHIRKPIDFGLLKTNTLIDGRGLQLENANVTNGARIVVNLSLPTLMHPGIQEIKNEIQKIVSKQVLSAMNKNKTMSSTKDNKDSQVEEEIVKVDVKIKASKPSPFVHNIEEQDDIIKKLGPGLANVRHFIAVYSCKGGVGKSTVAVNLAYEMSRMGGRIGLLDVDIYGPSLPVLVQPDDPVVRRSSIGPGIVKPIVHEHVKMLSLGFVSPTSGVPGSGPSGGAAVMRGPMAGRVVTQLLKGTEWGELDVLILDMPPGTGDVQLTICQDLELSGAVSVTTPSKLAATDAAKGIEMFTSLGVRTLAIVENMSYFDCQGGSRHYPFGKSIVDKTDLVQNSENSLDESNIFQLPISSRMNEANDDGSPLCLSRPEEASVELDVFHKLSSTIAKDLLLLDHGQTDEETDEKIMIEIDGKKFHVSSLHLSVDNDKQMFIVRLFSDSGATQVLIPGDKLRSWHPKLGEALPILNHEHDEDKVIVTQTSGKQGRGSHGNAQHPPTPKLFPCKLEKKGKYGYSVEWADRSTIIYSMYSLGKAAAGGMS